MAHTPDRRQFTLAFTGAALPANGPTMLKPKPWDGPAVELASVERTLAGLAGLYDSHGPRKIGLALEKAEESMRAVFTAKMPPARLREAKHAYARLLTMGTAVAADTGDHLGAGRSGELAASLAMETGDTQTAAHAWSEVAYAQRRAGRERAALLAAGRARMQAGRTPAGVRALLEHALAAGMAGDTHTVLETVALAEGMHRELGADTWGTPGRYSPGTYHPGAVRAFAGAALAHAGMHREAAPRMEEAADIYAGTGSLLMAYVWMSQARALLRTGDVGGAHGYASMAVATAERRPVAWVVADVAALERRQPGAFADLAGQTSRWGFDTTGSA